MVHLSVINDTQKGINTSLTLSLLGELRENIEDWKIQAHDIVYWLNRDPDSPWLEHVNMTEAKGMHRPVNLASFANALKPLLRQHGFFDIVTNYVLERLFHSFQRVFALSGRHCGDKVPRRGPRWASTT